MNSILAESAVLEYINFFDNFIFFGQTFTQKNHSRANFVFAKFVIWPNSTFFDKK